MACTCSANREPSATTSSKGSRGRSCWGSGWRRRSSPWPSRTTDRRSLSGRLVAARAAASCRDPADGALRLLDEGYPESVIPQSAIVRDAAGRLRVVSFAEGWQVFTSDHATKTLVAVCLEPRT